MAAIDATEQAKGMGRAWLAPLLLLAACSSPPSPLDASVIDTIDVVHDAGPPHEYVYVIDQITIDPTDDPSVPHTGFNLDGLFSSATDPNGCLHQDFLSATDPDQSGGVDNQLPTLANTILAASNTDARRALADAVQNNQFALLVRVSGITDDTNSPNVTVRLYNAFPTFTSGCAGGVLPGREYSVSQGSIATGGTTIDDALSAYPARIVGGRLQVEGDASRSFPLTFPPILGHQTSFTLHAVQLRADLSATSLSRGALGGWLSASDLIAQSAGNGGPSYPAVLESVLGGMVDIQILGVCTDFTDTPNVLGGISLAFGLHAVPATISATMPIVDAPALGTCANPLSDAGVDASQSADGG